MVINPFKAFLFIAGGATAAVATAYVSGALDPHLHNKEMAAVAASPEPGSPAQPAAPTNPAKPKEGRLPQKSAPADPVPAKEAAGPAVIPPSFDLLRAESNGSIVIAGKAAPKATVEIVAGAQVLGTTKAGADGDFAIVLDDPLKPGGHELVLRSTTDDKVVATSPETAVVSIPEEKQGQVLALVEKPGEPSKLITVPEPEPAAPKPAAQDGEPAAEAEVPRESKEPAVPEQPAVAQNETAPADPEKAPAKTLEQPETAKSEPPAARQDAAASQPAAPATQPVEAADEPKVAVDAVEIEGRNVFVAGGADPGRQVRVYANDILLGEALVSPDGRFLVETERDLPVGDYIIRADALEPGAGKVVARAAVPFEREPGDAVAAVAPKPQPIEEAPAAASVPKPASPATPEAAKTPPASAEAPAEDSAAPAGTPAAAAQSGGQASASPPSAGEREAVAPKLQSVDGAVIIRRGDTLWRISRRVYGRGVRYSTIYLANQDQIRDPNRIWPGQVFNVPGKTPEGDAADMTAVKGQTAAPASPKAPL
jgi:nucleoid-associated protein YgaU